MKAAKGQRLVLTALALCLLLPCRNGLAGGAQKYSASFFDVFDTVTQLIGYADSEAAFQKACDEAHRMLERYHRVFDGYNAYDGVANLYAVNRDAANGPVQAEPELISLLQWAKARQKETPCGVNIAMGAVLELWHEHRTAGVSLPPEEALRARAEHTDISALIVDEENGTVFFSDPALRLDLGAVAKGWAAEQTARRLTEIMPSFLLSVGGNVRAGAQPMDGRARWGVSIQDPENENGYLDVLYIRDASVVTSGDYQRFYTVDGVRYHHLIDPKTLLPARWMRAVTVVTRDSGEADFLSTALFLMPYEDGRALVDGLKDVEAYWVLNDGTARYTDGLKAMLRSEGATARDP